MSSWFQNSCHIWTVSLVGIFSDMIEVLCLKYLRQLANSPAAIIEFKSVCWFNTVTPLIHSQVSYIQPIRSYVNQQAIINLSTQQDCLSLSFKHFELRSSKCHWMATVIAARVKHFGTRSKHDNVKKLKLLSSFCLCISRGHYTFYSTHMYILFVNWKLE